MKGRIDMRKKKGRRTILPICGVYKIENLLICKHYKKGKNMLLEEYDTNE